jgi:hypothetical protein
MSTNFRLVYEEDGYPRELLSEADWRAAIAAGRLTPETRVTMYRHGEAPVAADAIEIIELRPLFGVEEPSSTAVKAGSPPGPAAAPLPVPLREGAQTGNRKQQTEMPDNNLTSEALNILNLTKRDQVDRPWGSPIEIENDNRIMVVSNGKGGMEFKTKDGRRFFSRHEAESHLNPKRRQITSATPAKTFDEKDTRNGFIGCLIAIIFIGMIIAW